jgi:glycosyltransferase involved in cell wall biosynthesis
MALLEAQAAGVAVLAGNSGGVSGIVRDGETGWLVPEGDVEAFARVLASQLQNPVNLKNAGKKAAKNALEYHDISAAAQMLDCVISPIINAKDAGDV